MGGFHSTCLTFRHIAVTPACTILFMGVPTENIVGQHTDVGKALQSLPPGKATTFGFVAKLEESIVRLFRHRKLTCIGP